VALSGLNGFAMVDVNNGVPLGGGAWTSGPGGNWSGQNFGLLNAPHGIASGVGGMIYVGNATDGKIMKINPVTMSTTNTAIVPNSMCGLRWDMTRGNHLLWFTKNDTGGARTVNILTGSLGTGPNDLSVGTKTSGFGQVRLAGVNYYYFVNQTPDETGQPYVVKKNMSTMAETKIHTPAGGELHQAYAKQFGTWTGGSYGSGLYTGGLYVCDSARGKLIHISLTSDTIVREISLAGEPHSVFMELTGNTAYVTVQPADKSQAGQVTRVDLVTGTEIGWGGNRIDLPSVPGFANNGDVCGITLKAGGGYEWLTHSARGNPRAECILLG